jgi:hypothetical protein
LLSKLANLKKVDKDLFQKKQDYLDTIVQLWGMTDRTIRSSLLVSMKELVELLPAATINKSIFDNIIMGFSDSNAK